MAAFSNDHPALHAAWHPVARSQDIGESPLLTTLLGERWGLARRDGTLLAVRGPRLGDLVPASPGLPPSGLAERYGLVWLAPADPVINLIDVPEWDSPGFDVVTLEPQLWNAGAAQMADNFLDVGHFPFTHRSSFGDPGDRAVEDYHVSRDGWDLRAVHHHRARTANQWSDATTERVQIFTYRAPFAIHLRIEYPADDIVRALLFALQPIDRDHTRLYILELRNDLADGRATSEETIAMAAQVTAEDQQLLEQFDSKALPVDLRAEVHTRADRITVELRRVLADFASTA